jgi:predicted ATPase
MTDDKKNKNKGSYDNKQKNNIWWINSNSKIEITINKIKSIKHTKFEIPLSGGVFLFVGNNGVGKSTIIYSMAQLMSKSSLKDFGIKNGDGNSWVEFKYNNINNHWTIEQDKQNQNSIFLKLNYGQKQLRINGMYEGSLFYGFRFKSKEDVQNSLTENRITEQILAPADDYIIEKLGYILRNDSNYYKTSNLLRIKNKEIIKELGFQETPYFMKIGNEIISQYEMSSGECLMLSLLHFIYHSIERRSLDIKYPVLMLIDEIELALHPIAVSRLLELFNNLTEKRNNLTIILTSHSPEVINKVKPKNIYLIEEDTSSSENSINIINPCYPSYAIRDVYRHDGYDWLLLVEDELAKIVLDKIISDIKLTESQLIHITPVGGWRNVLKLQYDLFKNNVLGADKQIISILDGDIKAEANSDKWKSMPKLFLPFASVEKFLKDVLIDKKDNAIYKRINDEFFQLKPLNEIINEYKNNSQSDNSGKNLYSKLIYNVKDRGISEDEFVLKLSKIIEEKINFSAFKKDLEKLIKSK